MSEIAKTLVNFENLVQLTQYFSTEQDCIEYLALKRWKEGKPVCPYCGCQKAYKIEQGKRYKCSNLNCKSSFSIKVGTIFEGSMIPLRTWFIAIYLISSHKKGVSSHQLGRDLGVSQKAAWFILHRIREVFKDNDTTLYYGEVQVDESFLGGKEKNKHQSKKRKGTQGGAGKQAVMGMLQKDGKIKVEPIPDRSAKTLIDRILNVVQEGSEIFTDEHGSYSDLDTWYNHQTVNHGAHEYVNGYVTVNAVENFWSLFKRGIYGVYHWCSRKHLQRYCDEFSYRFNTREYGEGTRFDDVIELAVGKRLKYRYLIIGARYSK